MSTTIEHLPALALPFQRTCRGEALDSRCDLPAGTNWRSIRVAAVSAVLIACVAWGYGTYLHSPSKVVERSIEAIESRSPMMLDEETRLDGAEAGPTGELVYLYTLVQVSAQDENVSDMRAYLDDVARFDTIDASCSAPHVRALIDLGVTLVYRYDDVEGNVLGSIGVGPRECREWDRRPRSKKEPVDEREVRGKRSPAMRLQFA